MSQLNAYIRIEICDSNAICHYYPPKEGGMPLSVKEEVSGLEKALNGIAKELGDSP